MNITSHPPAQRNADSELECVLPRGAHLAEGPVWSPQDQRLYWVDILAPSVHRFDPETQVNEEVALPHLVSAVILRRGGGLVALTQDGLEAFEFATGHVSELVDPEAHLLDNRFNDGKCDRAGRLWAGSMSLDASRPTGALYAIADLTWSRADHGFTVANGLDWSPDGRTFYFVDSAPGRIYAYDFELMAGTLSNRQVFVEVPTADGRPDGLTVDADGFVWCAIWDGWCVRRYAPDRRLDREVRLPVPRPTSVCFGGRDLNSVHHFGPYPIAVADPGRAPFSGGLFALPVDVPGLPPSGCWMMSGAICPDLAGQTVLMTSGADGIGRAVVELCATQRMRRASSTSMTRKGMSFATNCNKPAAPSCFELSTSETLRQLEQRWRPRGGMGTVRRARQQRRAQRAPYV